METLLGGKLQGKDGEGTTSDLLGSAEIVGIYFSAHWCGPCRGFTPRLVDTYNTLRQDGKKIEIVFVSSDRDQTAFDSYYKDMPWLALPYAERDMKAKLSKKFKVRGIPSLIFLDREGNIVAKDGRGKVMGDPKGEHFPWTPKPVNELLGDTFLTPEGNTVGAEAIKDKYIGLYFSAHWCPPCKKFTPEFAKTYSSMKDRGVDNFEVIFISSDQDAESFNEYRKEMPWPALPFEDRREEKEALSERFEVSGIPTLVILGPGDDRPVVNADGRQAVSSDKDGTNFPWHPPLVPKLEDASSINDTTTVIVLAEGGSPDGASTLRKTLESVAETSKAAGGDVGFALAEPGDQLAERVRGITGRGTASEKVECICVDVQNGSYYVGPDSITAESINKFVEDIKSANINREKLQF